MAPMQGSPGSAEYLAMSPAERAEMDQYFGKVSHGMASSMGSMSADPAQVDVVVETSEPAQVQTPTGTKTVYPPLVAAPPPPPPLPPEPTIVSKKAAARIAARAAAKTVPPAPAARSILSEAEIRQNTKAGKKSGKRLKTRSIKIPKKRRSERG